MNAETKIEADPLSKLREPFPEHHVSKLPKETRKQADERKAGNNIEWKCAVCGGMHHKNATHLDYVGHAALTDRLLDVDPHWSWEPMGRTPEGLPVIAGGLWIKLTICGVSRYGFGAADGKTGGDAVKEMIGDALRNAAMRFGAALDLWHKGDLHVEDGAGEGHSQQGAVSPPAPDAYPFPPGPASGITQLKAMVRPLWREIKGCGDDSELDPLLAVPANKAIIEQCMALENPTHRRELWDGDGKDNPGLDGLIRQMRDEFAQRPVNILQAG